MTLDRRGFLALGALAGAALVVGCAPPEAAGAPPRPPGLTDPARVRVADAIISSFENSTVELPYAEAQDLDDGRGITAGRAGFTSGTHDLLLVVQRYEELAAGQRTPLTRYLAPLRRIDAAVADDGDAASTAGLSGFADTWRETSRTDPRLNQAQDDVYRRLYFDPAMVQAQAVGLTTGLGQLIILDAAVQHGATASADGLITMIRETGAPGPDPDHSGWLPAFLEVRRAHLQDPADEETTEVWRESIPRVDTLRALLDQQRYDLETPLDWTFAGTRFALP
ncbi:chitosanase [Actinomycetospora sp. CA-101289]|uniref:chitosanase n=1 Tax=Actinomycetospora sp. CA-101289 TaxID=3239893 RepID=UPI003D9883FD